MGPSLAPRLALLVCAAGMVACTHTMEITNAHQYAMDSHASRPLAFEVTTAPPPGEVGMYELGRATKERLAVHRSVSHAAAAGESPPGFQPDYVVRLSPMATYEGSGWNYLVAFPGFLIFTHAWNGYVYHAHVRTNIELRKPDSLQVVASREVATDWDMRHCDFGRGAWTSSGWYTPFYGGINAIIGFFMIQYDDGATMPFVTALHDPYGEFIANNVVDLAAQLEAQNATPAAAQVSVPGSPPAETSPPVDPPTPPPLQ